MSAATRRRHLIDNRFAWIACCLLASSTIAAAQTTDTRAPHASLNARDLGTFLAGAAVALAVHETAHVTADVAFGAAPGLRKVSFSGIPFFAITHRTLSPGREFVISSAGLWAQEVSNELLLTRRPRLREAHAPFAKGTLAFNTITSVAYAGAAFGRAGPVERDTRGAADAARLREPWVGGLVLVPAVLDAARYYKPEMRWLRWASRASKVAGAALVWRAVS